MFVGFEPTENGFLHFVNHVIYYSISDLVGCVGLAPTKAVKPPRLQRGAIAAMRTTHKKKLVGNEGIGPPTFECKSNVLPLN